jgi:hypothetical protein
VLQCQAELDRLFLIGVLGGLFEATVACVRVATDPIWAAIFAVFDDTGHFESEHYSAIQRRQ